MGSITIFSFFILYFGEGVPEIEFSVRLKISWGKYQRNVDFTQDYHNRWKGIHPSFQKINIINFYHLKTHSD